uniref:ATP citrate synthase n=1 Tax=Rostrostelium ellipticum TaxID=361140 RepID=A0A1L2FUX7_9MYCE|nr:ATP citrate lyase [Rostrostelium ellipticum]
MNPSPPLTSTTPRVEGHLPARLFTKQSQALIYNYKEAAVQRMLDFDNVSQRDTPSVAGLIHPGADGGFYKAFFGFKELVIPVYNSIADACAACPNADVFLNFASHRSAYQSSVKALNQASIRTVVIIAEGMPENEARSLIALSKKNNKVIIGPATVGGIQAGAFKIGNTAGTIDNIMACKLYRSGSVGFVSKSGGLSNEMYNVLSKNTDGIYEGIAIGGDAFPGSTLTDHALRFEKLLEVKMIVILGELGGWDEYGIVEALKAGQITKPVCAWVSGTVASIFPTEVQFGHAGAKSGGETESAEAKNAALRAAGAIVPGSFEEFASVIAATYGKLVAGGLVKPVEEPTPPELPLDFKTAVKAGKVRKPTSIISTICDDRGEEPTYNGMPISKVCEEQYNVGDVIGLLWFKRQLPPYASKFIEMCLKLVADHGPCVSGAHNTIVAARAGKDLVSSLVSGLLTIGPRFGGAIDDAARSFKDAVDRKLSPEDFVEGMKAKGKRIPGIGHLIKSADDIDKRVLCQATLYLLQLPRVRIGCGEVHIAKGKQLDSQC